MVAKYLRALMESDTTQTIVRRLSRILVGSIITCMLIIMYLMTLVSQGASLPPVFRTLLYLMVAWVMAVTAYSLHVFWDVYKEEQELKESEETYRTVLSSILDSVGIGVSVISPDMQILSMNDFMQKRHPTVDVAHKPLCYKVFNNPPTDELCPDCPTRRTFEDGQLHESIREVGRGYIRKSVRIVSSPIRDDQDHLVAVAEVVEDITEQRRAEEALRESESKYRDVVERANDGIAIIQDEEIKYVNPSLARMVGGTPEELVGSPYNRYIAQAGAADFAEKYRKLLAGESVPAIQRAALQHKTGSDVPVELNVGQISYQGRPACLLLARDLSARGSA